ncbi:GIGYF family protein Gyf isoform X2 [Rhynchophorus ferrugineus]|uniref:GYF domain-containing protein n=1 Tax=Rhynchophorus ferrugineus TaxID=354439 RepID=A0A834I1B4_RHYFE|nr:hypothetical protein GWI33_016491 [Rhynchophorus ferrugineus]
MRDNLQFGLQPFMLIAISRCKNEIIFSMTDSMTFGPDWIRNLSSDGNTGGGTSTTTRCQLADYRYGREEMLALFDRNIKPPNYLPNFKYLYSEPTLPPLALLPTTDEERGIWQNRPTNLGGPPRGRGGSLERGGRGGRGRTTYQPFTRTSNYEGWGNGEQSDWSPRKEYNTRPMDNWRRSRNNEEDEGWRMSSGRGALEKWGRSTSWRGETDGEERSGPPERGMRPSWHDINRGQLNRKSWDNEDHLPEWANENPLESGGSFDDRGAFHGSDDEQGESKNSARRDGLQKSTSQQHISQKTHPPLFPSKSTISLVNKDTEADKIQEDKPLSSKTIEVPSKEHNFTDEEIIPADDVILEKTPIETNNFKEAPKMKDPPNATENQQPIVQVENKVEENELEKLQEDFVLKLVSAEEETLKQGQPHNTFDISNLPPPPNLSVPGQEKWFYQDPQGQMQGPFTAMEMTEWYKAGYFGQDLKIRRQCDERFCLLGDLVALSGGGNPFQANVRFPVLKLDISKIPEGDLLQYQYLTQLATYKPTAPAGVMSDTWGALNLQQQELAAQRLIMQQPTHQDLQYIPQPPTSNPLMHMLSQLQQQAHKLPSTNILDKRPPNMPGAIDPHMIHMTNFLSMQNRLPGSLPNQLPTGIPGPLPPENIPTNLPGLSSAPLGTPGIPISTIPMGLNSGLGMNVPRPSSVEHSMPIENDPIASLLKQLHQQKQNQVESLWPQNQFASNNVSPPQQWSGPDPPLSMWDIQQPTPAPTQSSHSEQNQPESSPKKQHEPLHSEKEKAKKSEKHKENKHKEDDKEQKKKKKAEEEQLKKEAEEKEKRKQEQRKLEMERKVEAEKKKKEEERIKKEIEKAKKEAEEKRQRELEEKRKLKEQRKLEEEARKKAEEIKKIEEERIQKEKEQREKEERQRAEERRQEQISLTKSAPWSQANSNLGLSLAEIQKAEKEKKAQEAALAQKALQEKEQKMLQQQHLEKPGSIQLGWAKKPLEPRKVKSLAEIQAEEQERLAKEVSEARLRKEKEAREVPQLPTTNSIWSGQTLTWASASSTNSQWSSTVNTSGFWEEPAPKQQPNKPSNVSKSSSMSTINNSSKQAPPLPKQQKTKTKKEEQPASKKNNHNNNIDDEFTSWCYKALENISTNVDVPTFVTFLRDIESAFEVREYCKEYLGENNMTQQFANSFLEKRRSFKSKESHKDDMCSPAPAITPAQHNMEFQEVKGKNKKSKKSKMLKVDSRILGFNVTSAPDRINVGDRDYGDTS